MESEKVEELTEALKAPSSESLRKVEPRGEYPTYGELARNVRDIAAFASTPSMERCSVPTDLIEDARELSRRLGDT
jgi:hypothetical protein